MKMKMMDRPVTREDFERKFNLLHRMIEENRFHVGSSLSRNLNGISRVRCLPNGRIDFLSVDESARSTANSIGQFSITDLEENSGDNEEQVQD